MNRLGSFIARNVLLHRRRYSQEKLLAFVILAIIPFLAPRC